MDYVTMPKFEMKEREEEAVLEERRGCAETVCFWCAWARLGLPGPSGGYRVEAAVESEKYLYLHAFRYQDGGSGAMKCEAGGIWARG